MVVESLIHTLKGVRDVKISTDEARKQKELMEQHLCDQIQVFEEHTGLQVAALELVRSSPLLRDPSAWKVIDIVAEVRL